MVLHNATLVPSLGLRIGPACEAGLSAGMGMEHVPPQRRKKEDPDQVGCVSSGRTTVFDRLTYRVLCST